MTKKDERIIKYDLARVVAILCVILCHSVETIYNFSNFTNINQLTRLSVNSRIFLFTSFTIGRLGVPIFFFLSGAFLLKKQIEGDEDVLSFYRNNLLPLIIANTIWVVLYNLFFYLSDQTSLITTENVIKELLFIHKVPVDNMWYMPVVIGVYLGIPFMAKIVKSFSLKSLKYVILGVFIVYSIIPTVSLICRALHANFTIEPSLLEVHHLAGLYGLYTIMGYYIENEDIRIKKRYLKYPLLLILLILSIGIQLFSLNNGIPYKIWYNNTILFFAASVLFLIFKDSKVKLNNKIRSLITFISKNSLSIFFIHEIVLYYFNILITDIETKMPIKTCILFFITFIASLAISFIITRNKTLAKYIVAFKE